MDAHTYTCCAAAYRTKNREFCFQPVRYFDKAQRSPPHTTQTSTTTSVILLIVTKCCQLHYLCCGARSRPTVSMSLCRFPVNAAPSVYIFVRMVTIPVLPGGCGASGYSRLIRQRAEATSATLRVHAMARR